MLSLEDPFFQNQSYPLTLKLLQEIFSAEVFSGGISILCLIIYKLIVF